MKNVKTSSVTKEQIEKKSSVTKEQIEEWKALYGGAYRLTTECGKVGYIKDPLCDLKIMKQAFTAMGKSSIMYVQAVLNNCWLQGDELIMTDEKFGNGLEEQISEFTKLPESEVIREGSKYIIKVEGLVCEVRGAKRADIIQAEQKNAAKEPFETAVNLLNIIKLKGVDEIKKASTRAYIGLLTAVDKVKDKAFVNVEKL